MLIADGEESGEIFGAASDRDQAAMVYNVAKAMVAKSRVLSKMEERKELLVVDSKKRIIHVPTDSVYQVIAADAAGNLGANPSAILFDEILAQPNRDLWDYMRQGAGTRLQSLLLGVTTPGPDRNSFAYTEHEFGLRVAEDPELDPSRFVYIANVAEGVDWEDESHWHEANPGMWTPTHRTGFLSIDVLRAEAKEAKNKGDLSEIANFKIFRLAQWGNRTNAWLDINVWDEMEDLAGSYTDEDIGTLPGVGGFDLAETMDLAAWIMVFPAGDRVIVKAHFWITRNAIKKRHAKMLGKFLQWEQDGLITVFDQDVHDYDKIRDHMLADIVTFNITDIGYDPFQAPAIVSKIESTSDTVCEKIPQTTTRMNAGARELTRYMGVRCMTTNKNPILRWNADVATYKQDSDRHIKPDKQTSTGNIDGITALVNALSVLVQLPEPAQDAQLHTFEDDDLWGDDDDGEDY